MEIGVDSYNPLEAKAGMDVMDLRGQFGASPRSLDAPETTRRAGEATKAKP